MIRQDYEYRGLLAATWDLLRGDTSTWNDRFFYKEVIARYGQPVLDVGCGTGRLLLDYLGQGIDIDGVDNSPEMLGICREKAERLGLSPQLYLQQMESLEVPRTFRTILVPSSSFQLLTDLDDARHAMRRFHALLQRGGVLAMPFMILWKDGDLLEHHDWKVMAEKVRPEDGAVVRKRSRTWYDVANRLEHTDDIFEVTLEGAVVAREHHRRSPATRWYTQDEAVSLFRQAGFSTIHAYAEFTFEPAPLGIPLFTIVGQKLS
jgi:ubiquinone/menaquinone biosynthesis C-methylase UbiE